MSNLSLTRVNQKLAQAKALLQPETYLSLAPIHQNSLKEAAAFHLVCAYKHYLREIAEAYWLKNAGVIQNEAELSLAFNAAKKYPAEVEELNRLRQDEYSWLNHLHSYYESLWRLPVQVLSDTEMDNDLIKVVNLNKSFDVSLVDLPLISSWREEFVLLVMRQRETSAEF